MYKNIAQIRVHKRRPIQSSKSCWLPSEAFIIIQLNQAEYGSAKNNVRKSHCGKQTLKSAHAFHL